MYGIEDETDAVMVNHCRRRSKDGRLSCPIERYEPAGAPPKVARSQMVDVAAGTSTGSREREALKLRAEMTREGGRMSISKIHRNPSRQSVSSAPRSGMMRD